MGSSRWETEYIGFAAVDRVAQPWRPEQEGKVRESHWF